MSYSNTAPRAATALRTPRDPAALERILATHSPSYYTAVGLQPARFVRFQTLHRGEVGAIFRVAYYNNGARRGETIDFLYGVDFKTWQPVKLKEYPIRYS